MVTFQALRYIYTKKRADSVEKSLGATVVKTLTGICTLTTRSPLLIFCLISSVLAFMDVAHSIQTVEDSQQF